VINEVLTGRRVRLRPVKAADESALTQIFHDPEVARWWGDPSKSVADAMEVLEGESRFVIEHDGEAIGFIQCVEETDPMYEHASIDISLRSEWQGKGIGPDAIRTLARFLIDNRGHHRLTIDPAAHNTRAIKAYESVGFKPVGLMRNYERGPDGTWHDGLLMDMLADELTLT
jgi:aminoglycoside 6'-N-acetyltransferase